MYILKFTYLWYRDVYPAFLIKLEAEFANMRTNILVGSFSKPRWRRRRECHETKGLMSRTIAVHVSFESLYISSPSSAKKQREMSKFYVV